MWEILIAVILLPLLLVWSVVLMEKRAWDRDQGSVYRKGLFGR